MFEVFTGWKIGVELADADGPYVIVPEPQLAELCRLLAEQGIPHAIDGAVPSRHHAESPFVLVVRLGLGIDVSRTQDIVDLVP